MRFLQKFIGPLFNKRQNKNFLIFLDDIEDFFAKILALIMIGVILFAIIDLGVALAQELQSPLTGNFSTSAAWLKLAYH